MVVPKASSASSSQSGKRRAAATKTCPTPAEDGACASPTASRPPRARATSSAAAAKKKAAAAAVADEGVGITVSLPPPHEHQLAADDDAAAPRPQSSANVVNVNAYTNVEDDEAAIRAALGSGSALVADNENLIVQLNVEAPGAEVTDHHMPYTPHNTFQSCPMLVVSAAAAAGGTIAAAARATPDNAPSAATPAPPPAAGSAQQQQRVVELLKDFEMKSRASEWPSSTSISCYWCCHTFSNPPFGIPVKYVEATGAIASATCQDDCGKFYVFGCFCSLECAAAYNFDACADSVDEKWERYNLINFLGRRLSERSAADGCVGGGQGTAAAGRVKLAPNRLALKMFGGHMTIDEFRASASSAKIVNINFPPMATLTQQVEELNDTDVRSEYRYIPLDIERINRYKEKIVLKRSKPTTASKKNTLDSLMNLRFSSG